MKAFRAAAASAAVSLLSGVVGAYAADLDTMKTKAPVVNAPVAVTATCTNIVEFFTTACQLAWYGVRFYGTIDIGFGYQTHGAPWDRKFGPGDVYLISKMGNRALWELSPNALSQSNVGVQIKEPLGLGWSFVGQLETSFDPFSLELANGPGSQFSNIGRPLPAQTSNGDSSTAGQFYNSLGFAGFSHDVYGTLTFMRQNALTTDGVRAYDPMGGAYAFSVIGFSGATAGGGVTEDARATTSVKYRVNIGDIRLGVFGQFGGYELNNGSRGAIQGTLGGDLGLGPGILSLDAVGGFTKDAVSLGLGPSASTPLALLTAPSILTATISNNTSVMALGKYTVDRLKIYAGYEWIQFAPPSDPVTAFNNLAGDFLCLGCQNINFTNINNTAFSGPGAKDKILQIVWTGVRYSITDTVDVAAAYYHYDQNQFTTTAATIVGCARSPSFNSACAGTLDAGSFLVDWKVAPKWDLYVGTFFSQVNGGLDNGYLQRNNWATTAGVRFRW